MTSELRLEDLQIATPCGVSWDDMRGDARVRHCDHCMLNVYNIESMTRDDAMALIKANEGERVCIRMMRREDGTVITADCPVGLSRVRRRMRRMVAGIAALFGLGGVSLAVQSDASKIGLKPAVESQPFTLISQKVFGRKPPPPPAPQRAPMGRVAMGAFCITPPAQASTTNTTPTIDLTIDRSLLPVEDLP